MYLRNRSAQCRRIVWNLLADYISFVYTSVQLSNLEPIELNDLIISQQVEEIKVALSLSRLDDNNKSGPDGIPPHYLKHCRSSLFKPLTYLYNKSLSAGIFPVTWKQNFIFPIHKSGDKNNASNYSTVSIIFAYAKIFGSIVSSKIFEFIFLKIGPFQHGFIKGRSVLKSLLLYNNFLFTAFKNGVKVDLIYIEILKSIWHCKSQTVTSKSVNIGIRGKLFSWLQSYLTYRTQRVWTHRGLFFHGFQLHSFRI